MKRLRTSSSSDSSDNESPSTSFSKSNYESKTGTPSSAQKKPAEVFRKDLISAMKLPDSHHISTEDYYLLADTWRQEWEKGVQVLASPDTIPHSSVRVMVEKPKEILFSRPRKYIQCWSQDCTETGYVNIKELAEAMCRYDLDDMDLYWLKQLNLELLQMGEGMLDELTMERVMESLERRCHDSMNHAIETEEGLGIEYDEDVICDVCRSPDSEEGNDMVFCDKCNICVHQACYGIVKVPDGNWLCRTCVLGINPQCVLCPKRGGAMKATRAGTKWAHVSCALWIPEVSIACPERMEPITKLSHIPPSRWSLICSLCKLKTGACIQCSVKNCTVPFHVTCAFEHSLEMKTILDEGDEVKFKSYCLKHSKTKTGESGLSPARHKPPTETEKVGLRAQKLQELEEEFYKLVQPEELAQELGLSLQLLDFIYQYWKLKRKSSFNKALLPPKEDEENMLLQPQEDSIHTRMRMFMHLRQDLERVRNLCYMVSRREKLKLSQSKAQEQIFNLHVKLINQELAAELPVSSNLENFQFQTPPRITLKLKMPKLSHGSSKASSKTGNGPLCPDNSSNVYDVSKAGIGQGKPLLQHSHPHGEERPNGIIPISKPTGKPLALQAALHGHTSNGKAKPEQERSHQMKSSKAEQERSHQVKSSKSEQERSQLLKFSKPEHDRSPLLKSIKPEQDRSLLLKFSKPEQDRSHLLKSNKLEQDRSHLLKSSKLEQDRSHLLKSSKLEQDRSHLLKSSKLEQDRSHLLKSSKLEQDRSHLLKSSKLEQDRSHLLKSSKLEQDRSHLLKSSKLEQDRSHLLKSSKLEQDRSHLLKPNGIMEKPVVQRNTSYLSSPEHGIRIENSGKGQPGSFHESTMEHFGRTFKEATVSLVRTSADHWNTDKTAHKTVSKERLNCTKAVSGERTPKIAKQYQEADGYCPDLELSDSEPEARGKRQRVGRGTSERSPAGGFGRGGTRVGVSLGSRTAVQR